MVEGFAQAAHLAKDLAPSDLRDLTAMKKTATAATTTTATSAAETRRTAAAALDEDGSSSGSSGSGGEVPAGSALLLSVGAFALGLAFQNQKAWAEMSSARSSRDQYSALI